jgi:hypothetical protein
MPAASNTNCQHSKPVFTASLTRYVYVKTFVSLYFVSDYRLDGSNEGPQRICRHCFPP